MKLFLTFFIFIIFNSSFLFHSEINSSVKNDSKHISLLLKSNKTYCTQINDEIIFEVFINNQSIIPKFNKFLCINYHDWSKYMIVLDVVHNEQKYMSNNFMLKCATPSLKLLIKGKPVSMSEVVRFKSLVKQSDANILVRKENTDYGVYSVQAAYILRKDTLYSNKIFIEFKKE